MTLAPTRRDAEHAVARGAVYMLLAHALAYPSPRRLTGLRERMAPVMSQLETGDPAVDAPLRDLLSELKGSDAALREAHIQQFTHITSPDCPTHETAYSERDVFRQAQQMADIAGFYRAWGFDIGGQERERPDQISVELEFMATLARKEAQAIEQERADALAECRRSQGVFLQDHLGCWGSSLGRRIAGRAAAPFYRAAGELLAAWIDLEIDASGATPSRLLDEPQPQPPPEGDDGCGIPDGLAAAVDEPAFVDLRTIQ